MDDNSAVGAEPIDDIFDAALLGSRNIRSLMNDLEATVSPAASVREVAAKLSVGDISLIGVGEPDEIEGVVSERDIVRAVADGLDLDTTPIAALESRDLLWATPDSTIAQVAAEMMENYVRHILIRDEADGRIGIVSMRDVLTEYLD